MAICEYCGGEFAPTFISERRLQRFCSGRCRIECNEERLALRIPTKHKQGTGMPIAVIPKVTHNSDIVSALRGGGIPTDIIELFIITVKER